LTAFPCAELKLIEDLMISRTLSSMPLWKRLLLVAAIGLVIAALYRSVRAELHRNATTAVTLTGYQHIGPNFNIAGFYVNGYDGGNVGREGGGGSKVCCVLLPKKWRPGLVVEVRWAVGDWSKENRTEINAGVYKSVAYTCFKAMVPVEKYESAERVFAHFFSGGKVRIVSSMSSALGSLHPVQIGDPHAADSATPGQRVYTIFTDAEMAEMQHQYENRNTFFGDWR
jgi:hypothetical protein